MNNQKASIQSTFGGKVRVRVGGLLLEEDKILLLKHNNIGPDQYLWSPPGGGAEFGSDLPSNLAREFKEETGLQVEVGPLLFVNEFMDDPIHAVELFFSVKRLSGEVSLGTDPEMKKGEQILSEWHFFSVDDLKNEKKQRLHNMFHGINNLQEVLNHQGYFKFVNNSIK